MTTPSEVQLERYGNVPRIGHLVTFRVDPYFMNVFARVRSVYHERSTYAIDLAKEREHGDHGKFVVWRGLDGVPVLTLPSSISWGEAVPVRIVDQ